MHTSYQSAAALTVRRRQRCADGHARQIGRKAPSRPGKAAIGPSSSVGTLPPAGAEASSLALLRVGRRRQAALQAATLRIRHLQEAVAMRERERNAALADTAELRLRHARLTTRLYMLEAERHTAAAESPVQTLAAILQSHLDRFSGIERQNEALGQALVLLRGDIAGLAHPALPDPAAVPPAATAGPWYRRFWLALIGKDARTAEWSASQRPR